MDRVADIESKINDMYKIQDEREWTAEEELDVQLLFERRSIQLEANERQLVANSARNAPLSQKRAQTSRWYHLRCSLTKLKDVAKFHKIMQNIAKSSYIDKKHDFTYVLEQSGADRESRGHNPHAHIRFRSSLTMGRLLAKLKRATGLDGPAIKLVPHDNVNALREYMRGHKGSDPVKLAKCAQDKCWRIEEGLKMEYTCRDV